MQVNVLMRGQKLIDALGLVRREVVGDHMNLLAARLVDHDVSEEGDEFCRCVSLGGLAQYLASLGVEGGVQRQRTVSEILKSMPLGASRRERQHWIFAIQG